MAHFEIYAQGIVHTSVCSTLGPEETTARLNVESPTGLDHGWHITDQTFKDGTPNPCPCNQDPSRKHYLFTC